MAESGSEDESGACVPQVSCWKENVVLFLGKTLIISKEIQGTPVELPAETLKGNICCINYHGNSRLVLGTDAKEIVVVDYDTTSARIAHTWTHGKRAVSVALFDNGQKAIVADKTGEVYSFVQGEETGTHVLGHVSALTDMLLTSDQRYLLTSDRDEKIRVSNFPKAFVIESFCLGHSEFVTHLVQTSDATVASAGADGTIRFWVIKTGDLLSTYSVGSPEEGAQGGGNADEPGFGDAQPKLVLNSLAFCSTHSLIAASVEGSSNISVLRVTHGDAPCLASLCTVTASAAVASVAFDSAGQLLATTASVQSALQCWRFQDDSFVAFPAPDALTAAVGKAVSASRSAGESAASQLQKTMARKKRRHEEEGWKVLTGKGHKSGGGRGRARKGGKGEEAAEADE